MKAYILVGAVTLFTVALIIVPAMAADVFTAVGTVIDERGNPVPGANVTLIDDSFHEIGTTTTDTSGNFKFLNVHLPDSPYIKAKVAFVHNGITYTNRLENIQWYDASNGLISFDRPGTRLYHYPESDHGYVWGPVMDSTTNGRVLGATVYLINNTTTLTVETLLNGTIPMYQIDAAPGEYEIYAVHDAGDYWMVSNRTKITIAPSYSIYESAPMVLVADVMTMAPAFPPVQQGDRLSAYGAVTDVQGNPVAGANVTLIDDNFRSLGSTDTDEHGNFHFIDVIASGSGYVKAKVSYVEAGQTYSTSLENVRWNDASSGLLNFDPMDTRLYSYPPGDHGYVWGVVLDSLTGGKAMDSTVYLKNSTVMLSTSTSAGVYYGGFQFEVSPGEYEIYAVHGTGNDRLVSNRSTINVYQSNDILQSAPVTLFVDRRDPVRPVEVLPMAMALILGFAMIFALWTILGRER